MSDVRQAQPVPPGSDPGGFGELLPLVQRGDETAARLVVERLYGHVRKIVLVHLPRRDDPEDVMQEVFLKVFGRLQQFRGEVPFEHWVARVALFTCLDRLRRQRVRPELCWSELTGQEQALLAESADEQATAESAPACARELVEKLLRALKPEEQLLIRWVELEQKPISEVCALTGWSSGVTRIRLFRARQKLKQAYRRLEKERP